MIPLKCSGLLLTFNVSSDNPKTELSFSHDVLSALYQTWKTEEVASFRCFSEGGMRKASDFVKKMIFQRLVNPKLWMDKY